MFMWQWVQLQRYSCIMKIIIDEYECSEYIFIFNFGTDSAQNTAPPTQHHACLLPYTFVNYKKGQKSYYY